MPFQSQAQRAFMYARHPQIARRWESLTPKGQKLPEHVSGHGTSSEESPNPGIQKLPRKSGAKRDFGNLHPGPIARMKISKSASEPEAMAEKPSEAHTKGERGKMSLKYHDESRLQGRDIKVAARRP
ncbi:MAG TPA: hypothetical protein VMT20_06945 [Terriglobia bacterium]|nr:hypothetical protein [Terriglobia bacterium]